MEDGELGYAYGRNYVNNDDSSDAVTAVQSTGLRL